MLNIFYQGSESPEDHTHSLWKEFVRPSKASSIAVVAHSFGGVCTLNTVSFYNKLSLF